MLDQRDYLHVQNVTPAGTDTLHYRIIPTVPSYSFCFGTTCRILTRFRCIIHRAARAVGFPTSYVYLAGTPTLQQSVYLVCSSWGWVARACIKRIVYCSMYVYTHVPPYRTGMLPRSCARASRPCFRIVDLALGLLPPISSQ